MIVYVLLDGLVAHDDAESTPRVDIDGFLHIQVAEGNRLLVPNENSVRPASDAIPRRSEKR